MNVAMESREGRDNISSTYPVSVAACESTAWLRNHRQPRIPRATGSRNAAKPKTWNPRSEAYAPTGPIQLWVRWSSPFEALTLKAASLGEYEIKANPIRIAAIMHKKPISSLSRLFSVGVRKRTRVSSARPPLEAMPAEAGFWGRLSVREHNYPLVSPGRTRRCGALLQRNVQIITNRVPSTSPRGVMFPRPKLTRVEAGTPIPSWLVYKRSPIIKYQINPAGSVSNVKLLRTSASGGY